MNASDLMIAWNDVYKGDMDSNVQRLMQVMDDRDYSYVPIVDGKNLVGMMYLRTLLRIIYNPIPGYNFRTLLRVENVRHLVDFNEVGVAETVGFITPDTSHEELLRIFSPGNMQVTEILIITEDGTRHGKPLGIITPWDLIRK